MTDTIQLGLNARRAHDIGDACDRIWAIAFGTVAGREPSPNGLGPSGDHQLSQDNREPAQPNKRAGRNS